MLELMPVKTNPLADPMLFANLASNFDYKCITNVTLDISSNVEVLLLIDDLLHENYPP